MIRRLLITYCLFLLCILSINAQIYKYIGIEDGLSSRRVLSIQQGAQDYMWILTHKGIDRFDGKHFKHYKLTRKKKEVNFYPNLNQLFVDDKKTLWEFGKDGYVFKYDVMKDSFQLVFDVRKEYPHLKAEPITSVYFDSQKTIWMCCQKGLVQYNTENNTSKCINDAIKEEVISMAEGENNEFYFTTGKLIYKVRIDKDGYHSEMISLHNISLINYIYYHKESKQLIINTLLNGLFLYDSTSKNIFDLGKDLTDVSINTIKPYYKDPNEVLIATDGDGVYKLNLKTQEFTHFLKEDNRKYNKMNGSIIKDLCIDKDNRIWNVIYPTGITIYSEKYHSYEWHRHSNDNKNSLVDDRINFIMQDSDGDTWYATSNGISCYSPKDKKWRNFLAANMDDNISNNHIFISLCEFKPGIILAGGYMSGIYQIDKHTGKVTYAMQSAVKKGENPDKYIRSIFRDSENIIWGGGFYNLRSYDETQKKAKSYSTTYPISCINERDSNSLWIGTIDGLYLFDKSEDKLKQYELPDDPGCINTIYQSADGHTTYIGTYGNGLFIINNVTGKSKHYHTENSGLITNNIYSIAPNKFGNIFLGTENGLSLFDIKEELFTNWTKEQGLTASNFNQNAALNSSNGYLIFGSNEGVIILPDSMQLPRQFSNQMIFDNLSIMYRTVHPNEPESPLKKLLNETSVIELDYDQNTFSMDVLSVNYDNPSNIYYSWKLEGFFDEWTTPSDNNTIRYTNLSPGNYTLKVRAMLLDNKQLLEERSIQIIVGRPFWLTFWAFLLYALIIVGAAYSLVRYKMIQKDRRTSQEKINFFMHTAHDIRTPLTLIKAPLGEILKNEQLSEEGLMNINLAIQNTDNLSELANKLMNFQKEELYSSQVTVSKYELNSYLKTYLQQFTHYAEQKELKFEYHSDFETLDVWIDRNKMDSILRNLISNALKYTPRNGTISVMAYHNKSYWMITITDTGIGISKQDQKKLFKYLFRGSNATNQLITGSGIGMLLTWRLIQNHEGKISFSSEENKGTTFHLSFPIRSNRYIYKENVIEEKEVSISDLMNESSIGINLHDNESLNMSSDNQEKKLPENAPHILVVEDNTALRNFLIQSLSDTYHTQGAENGADALDLISKRQPDLIISDVMMPIMNGHELCKMIKGNVETSHIPFIMLTALGDRKDILAGLEIKADLYIVKPFDITVLKANISNVIENRDFIRKKVQTLIKSIPQAQEMNINSSINSGVVNNKDYNSNNNCQSGADSSFGKEVNENMAVVEPPKMMSKLDDEFIQKVTTLVKEGLGKGLNVDTLCAAVNMSHTSFYNKIKALTGEAPADLIRNIRMQEASILLRTQKYTVSEVSDMLGFADPKYFTDTFKKYYGMPPSTYMKQNITNEQV